MNPFVDILRCQSEAVCAVAVVPAVDWWTKVSAIGTLLGAVLALLAFIVAIASLRTANSSMTLMREQMDLLREEHRMARVEHDAFLQELQAAPEVELRLEMVSGGAEVVGDHAYLLVTSNLFVRMRAAVRNTGRRPATSPMLTFLIPQGLRYFDGLNAAGATMQLNIGNPPTTAEQLGLDSDGPAAQYITIRPEHEIAATGDWMHQVVTFSLDVPTEGEVVVPARLKLSSPELPADVEGHHEMKRDLILHVAMQRQPGWPDTPE